MSQEKRSTEIGRSLLDALRHVFRTAEDGEAFDDLRYGPAPRMPPKMRARGRNAEQAAA